MTVVIYYDDRHNEALVKRVVMLVVKGSYR